MSSSIDAPSTSSDQQSGPWLVVVCPATYRHLVDYLGEHVDEEVCEDVRKDVGDHFGEDGGEHFGEDGGEEDVGKDDNDENRYGQRIWKQSNS